MAASSNMKRNYHVFLSFRGTDVRQGFLSHLYAALGQKGIYTFVDSEELRKGEEISPTLMKAIEESRIAIIVFSEDYASSPWCLEEAVKIMECKERMGLIVFPVFYKVEPREVRGGRESYGRAMAKHESKFGKDSEKVKRWKKALFEASSLSGWELNDRNEAELIQCIVKELSIHLNRTPLHVAKYPVGIDSQVEKLISLSNKESDDDDDVLMIGLWGPGGIGKTTIAKALFNAIERQFHGCSFLARVRETSNSSGGLVALQKKLMSDILSQRDLMVDSVDGGINLIQERLCCRKVLLVLDDVDQLNQLNALAGEGKWFGKGSRIIVTSRDKHLLTSHSRHFVYEVRTLEFNEALDLFYRHAFPNSKRVEIRWDLIYRAVQYANRLPLALEVLGSFLRGREESAWESTLHKLSKIPEQIINQVLKISFDGLEHNEREIFLDIACFFKGKSMMYIKEVLNSCDFSTTIGIEILIERSLIKNEYGFLQMHDLIQLMGKDIVNQECRDDPRKHSRLWLFEDVLDILSSDKEMNAVKAIVLELPTSEEITISPNAFTNMKMLRVLILLGVHISSQGPISLPEELRWLEWANAPDLEYGLKLVRLDVKKSHIKQLGSNFQNFRKLKSISFKECMSLTGVPDLSSAPNLESLELDRCKSLVEVHQSIGYLDKLKYLSLRWCFNLSIFLGTLKTKSLQDLRLSGCSKLEKFPYILGRMEHLENLELQGTAIKELPVSIENLISVKWVELGHCKNLMRLPSSIYKLKKLERLSLEECSNFVMFPKNLEDSTDPNGNLGFSNLECLELDGCNLLKVEFLDSSSSFPKLAYLSLSPTSINKYNYRKGWYVDKRKQLQESNRCIMEVNSCNFLQKLPDLLSLPSDCLQVDLISCCECKGGNMADVSSLERLPKMIKVDILLSGREMPKWILQCKDGFISFMVPRDLYDKFFGLAFCVVLGLEKGKVVNDKCQFQISVNGRRVFGDLRSLYQLESDHVWLYYLPRSNLGLEKLMQNDWSHFQVCFEASKLSMKKCGFRLICEQKEDDLRVRAPTPSADRKKLEFQGKRLKGRQFSIDTEEEDSPVKQNSIKKMRWF
ncbi:hypothetical protein EUGRSUZ_E03084 [Eucalyptus grandis]|uniref:ADP-ribosyl cyclase/cyclic ADP-ribose hydrolase n=2 Tax=Eucalyptus grandis TaxID=71139 RepID=A0A059C7S5_EUCGR|nr:hypothetical protein EUGRSUZ_E03084 [Eucalyptus grandis]